jgi:hypothetical protein
MTHAIYESMRLAGACFSTISRPAPRKLALTRPKKEAPSSLGKIEEGAVLWGRVLNECMRGGEEAGT